MPETESLAAMILVGRAVARDREGSWLSSAARPRSAVGSGPDVSD